MNEKDTLKATGNLTLTLRDQFGEIKQEVFVPNLVVTVGRNFIASRMAGTASAVMSHMAVGTSATAPVAANTALGAEIAASRRALATAGGVATANVVAYSATFPAGVGTGAVVEAGILNAATAGTLLCRTVFAVINKGSDDSLTINWNVAIN